MKIVVIGTGYVGLVSGACFSELGFSVVCVDKDEGKISGLNRGIMPIYERGLEELVSSNYEAGRISFSTDTGSSVADADIVFIAVGTPPDERTGEANLSYVFDAVREVAKSIKGYTLIVTKSTVPIGTGRKIEELMSEYVSDSVEYDVASNPEFLREGVAIEDFLYPDRVVIGAESDRAKECLQSLYCPLIDRSIKEKGKGCIFVTGRETAEMIKYASNSFLAMKVAFINEMADICEVVGANIEEVSQGMGLDSRIGDKFLRAGPGFGGSCFPKDTNALLHIARENGIRAYVTEAVIESNTRRKRGMADKIISSLAAYACEGGDSSPSCQEGIVGKDIAILGLTFKANTDDMRASPALDIVPILLEAGARLFLYDPEGMSEAQRIFGENKELSEAMSKGRIVFCGNSYQAADNRDALVILTEWEEFRQLDLERIRDTLKEPLLIDLRNLYSLQEMGELGFRYISIGR